MTSDQGEIRGIGRQGAHAYSSVPPEPPSMPPRWDDPPSTMSDADLVRMMPAESQSDPLLAAVSDAMWEPVKVHEFGHQHAQRLADIMAAGDELRERWAEMAALEEVFDAPTESASIVSRRRRALLHRRLAQSQAARRRRQVNRFLLAMALLVLTSAASVPALVITGSLGSHLAIAMVALQATATAVAAGTALGMALRRWQTKKPK